MNTNTCIMKAKLTLTVDQKILEEAKRYSKSHKKSLSSLIEEFLHQLSSKKRGEKSIVESTKGILRDVYKGKSDKEIREIIYKERFDV